MLSDQRKLVAFAAITAMLTAGCAGAKTSAPQTPIGPTSVPTPAPTSTTKGAAAGPRNQWLPLVAGYQTVREGLVTSGHRRLPHKVVTTVTDVTKKVDGFRTFGVLDQDFDGGELGQQSVDFLGEDTKGNVWYLGSYTEAYEGGQFVNANDAWLSGVGGAEKGVLMLADPRVGSPTYIQGVIPGEGEPTATVAKTRQSVCVPFKFYKNVVVIDDDGSEFKYFVKGLGQIKTTPKGSGGKNEIENLVNFTQLSPAGLAELDAEVLRLDQHARTEAARVFGSSTPARLNSKG